MAGPACCHPPVSNTKTTIRKQYRNLGFLDLPGELRNRIYDALFDEFPLCIEWNRPPKDLGHAIELRHKPRYRLSSMLLSEPPKTRQAGQNSWIPLELLRVCRKVYDETYPLLYVKTELLIGSMVALDRFLNIAPPYGVKNIRKLHLVHSTYGEPLLLDMREWKIRHDKKWMKLCRRIAEDMTGLESVRIDLYIHDRPTRLDTRAAWAKPLLVLKGTGLDRVDVILHHNDFDDQQLAAAARTLELEMMNARGRERKPLEDLMKTKKALDAARLMREKRLKARKILRITAPDLPMPTISTRFLQRYSMLQ
jgi:hypothetical protein